MHTFITPEPVTLEIRDASGAISVELTETTSTTVEVTASQGHPLGFLDDMFRAFGGGKGRGWSPFGEQSSDVGPIAVADDLTDAVRVDYRETDDGGTIIVDTEQARENWRSSFDITITAPTGSHIRVQATSADLMVTGAADRVEARSASGDVSVAEVRGKALVHTASGDIRINRAGSDVDLRTASGDIDLGPIAGDALLHTTSGDIRLGPTGGNISARSVSGDVRVADAMSGLAEVNAVTGDVEIGIHPGARASINLSTLTGNTATDFDVSQDAPDGEVPTLSIKVKTTSGDIRLRRAA